jgi:hypothetical protein
MSSAVQRIFEAGNVDDYLEAFRLVHHYLEQPNDIPSNYSAPNLLLFIGEALTAKNYARTEKFLNSPELWINLMKFRRSGYPNARDYFDCILMRASSRGLIDKIQDGMVRAALKYRAEKVDSYLSNLAESGNEISVKNSKRLMDLYTL